MDTFYRATLRLERVEPYLNKYDNPTERTVETASHTVTGDTAADAMTQLCAHADSLYEWHQQLADLEADAEPDTQPVITHMRVDSDALNKAMTGLFRRVLGKQEVKPPMPGGPISVRKCVHCGETIWLMLGPGGQEWQHGDSLHGHQPEPEPIIGCKAPNPHGPNEFCLHRLGHQGDCYYVPADQLPDSADDEGEPGQEGAEADDDPAFVEVLQEPAEPVTNRCAHCGEAVIPMPGNTWRHALGNKGHIADPEPVEGIAENRCAHCSEPIVLFADTDVWKHRRAPRGLLLDHAAEPSNLAAGKDL